MRNVSSAGRALMRPPLIAAARRLAGRAPRGLFRFLGVGLGGLAVDLAVLWLLERSGVGHAAARAVSLSVATLITWTLNRHYTFGGSGRRAKLELSRYAAVALFAQGVNYLVFLGVCAVAAHIPHALAAVIGAVAATGFSYSGQRFFTFARVRAGSD